jgi:hypothetical protein
MNVERWEYHPLLPRKSHTLLDELGQNSPPFVPKTWDFGIYCKELQSMCLLLASLRDDVSGRRMMGVVQIWAVSPCVFTREGTSDRSPMADETTTHDALMIGEI